MTTSLKTWPLAYGVRLPAAPIQTPAEKAIAALAARGVRAVSVIDESLVLEEDEAGRVVISRISLAELLGIAAFYPPHEIAGRLRDAIRRIDVAGNARNAKPGRALERMFGWPDETQDSPVAEEFAAALDAATASAVPMARAA